jgi:low temperature requirement protein LtrA
MIFSICYGLMRSVSVLELCLLAFLCLSMNALRMSVRDMAFGIALGFGIMSTSDFVLSFWSSRLTSANDPVQFLCEALLLAALGIWLVYCFVPEPAPRPVLMPASSAIYRWNEIASALGHTGTKVAVQQPANSFFLSDVERVVEKVLARNMRGRESET